MRNKKLIILIPFLIFTVINVYAQNRHFTRMNINNISTTFNYDGISDVSRQGNSGLIYPKGSDKTAVFITGLLWGIKNEGEDGLRIGGSFYRSGMVPGKIISPGVADDMFLIKYRIYRVRKDVYPGGPDVSFDSEIKDNEGNKTDIRKVYEEDWIEWPAGDGAPFRDVNKNGIYEPYIDIPGEPGADQTIWFVANDLNPAKTYFLYNTPPVGIEMQVTIWAHNTIEDFKNVIFRRYILINKSLSKLDSMYVCLANDSDIGNSTDDFTGCDTILNMGYTYNSQKSDFSYSPVNPPAVGFDLLQGPLVKGVQGEDRNKNGIDDARDFGNFKWNKTGRGYINLPMTSFFYKYRGNNLCTSCDPDPSDMYNYMKGGNIGATGKVYVNPLTKESTVFPLSGDPVARKGWIDGIDYPADDRNMGMSSGPFEMAPGDTQEIIIAEILAGTHPMVDNLIAITQLKFFDEEVQSLYNVQFITPVDGDEKEVPSEFSLSQNYPNPFNPVTKIKYAIGNPPAGQSGIQYTSLKVYDILGTEIVTLVDDEKSPGEYEIEFNGSGFPSGIYFYTLRSGNFTQTNKAILLK